MNYPIVLLLPVLQLLDAWLTFRTFAVAERVLGRPIRAADYELNPLWRQSIADGKTFTPRYLAAVAATTVLAVAVATWFSDEKVELFLGLSFATAGITVGRHLSNLLVLRDLAAHPEEISGRATFSPEFFLRDSRMMILGWLPAMSFLFLAQPSFVMAGAVVGVLLFAGMHLVWERRGRQIGSAGT